MENQKQKIRSFRDLDAWKEGHALVLAIYKITKRFPREELFGLISQMRRCVVSITSNIAEGFSRQSFKEKINFYAIAQGSVTELQNQLLVSRDVDYLSARDYDCTDAQATKVHKIINGLIKSSRTFILLFLILASYFIIPTSLFLIPDSASAAGIIKPPNNLGLAGYWSFEDARGLTATDFSGNGNTGTLTNMNSSTDWVNGKRGKALDFDGSDDYVDLPNSFSSNTAGTVSAWVYPTADNRKGIFSLSDSDDAFSIFALEYGATGGTTKDFGFYIYEASAVSFNVRTTSTFALNNWYHIVVTGGSGTGGPKIYVNGANQSLTVVEGSGTSTAWFSTVTQIDKTRIGNRRTGSTNVLHFSGLIDDVRVYNRALSASEVTALYNSGAAKLKAPTNLGLVGYWSFEDARGLTATDFSGNGNTGTLTNMNSSDDWVNGKRGKALDFDGSDDYVTLSNPTGLSTGQAARTISAWINPDQCDPGGSIVHYGNGSSSGQEFIVQCITVSGLTYLFTDGVNVNNNITISGTEIPPSNTWSHIAFTFNGINAWTYYLNGTQKKTGTFATTINTASPNILNIGDRTDVAQTNFPGLIDDVRVYNRALSASEVTALYNSGAAKVNVSTAGRGITSGLVGQWTFDGRYLTTSTATDTSDNGNNGTLTNGPVPAIGKTGQALSFDGSNDYVNVGDPASGVLDFGTTTNFSLSAWVKTKGSADIQAIIEKRGSGCNDGYIVDVRTTNKANVFATSTDGPTSITFSGNTVLSNNTWYHVVATYNRSGDATLYINGVNDGSTSMSPLSGKSVSNTGSFIIGRGNVSCTGSAVKVFNGSIDDVRVYNRALSASEVLQLYNMGK